MEQMNIEQKNKERRTGSRVLGAGCGVRETVNFHLRLHPLTHCNTDTLKQLRPSGKHFPEFLIKPVGRVRGERFAGEGFE
jgi:hypothetical protein